MRRYTYSYDKNYNLQKYPVDDKPKSNINLLIPTEKQDHMALVKWMSLHPILGHFFKGDIKLEDVHLFHHSPNGGLRNKKTITTASGKSYTYSPEGLTMKRMGVQSGFPDIFIPIPTTKYHGLFIELKPQVGGALSISQRRWLEVMARLGYKSAVCRGFNNAVQVIEQYLMDFKKEDIKNDAVYKNNIT